MKAKWSGVRWVTFTRSGQARKFWRHKNVGEHFTIAGEGERLVRCRVTAEPIVPKRKHKDAKA